MRLNGLRVRPWANMDKEHKMRLILDGQDGRKHSGSTLEHFREKGAET